MKQIAFAAAKPKTETTEAMRKRMGFTTRNASHGEIHEGEVPHEHYVEYHKHLKANGFLSENHRNKKTGDMVTHYAHPKNDEMVQAYPNLAKRTFGKNPPWFIKHLVPKD